MHICIVAEGYPFEKREYFTFVKQLCVAMADRGINVSVIAPQSISKIIFRKISKIPYYRIEKTSKGNYIDIYSPYIISLGNIGNKGLLKHFNSFWFSYGVCNVFWKNKIEKPDVLYGHFWHSAYAVYPVAKKYNIPLFVASGEAKIELHEKYSNKHLLNFINYVKGVICVSTKNKNESVQLKLTTPNKCIVIPNAVDKSLFYRLDKAVIRKELGIKKEDFVVAFVGGFIYRKGANRIAEAIKRLDDSSIKSIFIGKLLDSNVKYLPECNGIIYRGPIEHNKIAKYLNAADVFVMPTLHEGCCNANLEAMACGLPIISSDRDFNYDILAPSYSFLIDPLNIDEIANKILYLKNNPTVCKKMSEASFLASKSYDIEKRAEKIINFILSCL